MLSWEVELSVWRTLSFRPPPSSSVACCSIKKILHPAPVQMDHPTHRFRLRHSLGVNGYRGKSIPSVLQLRHQSLFNARRRWRSPCAEGGGGCADFRHQSSFQGTLEMSRQEDE